MSSTSERNTHLRTRQAMSPQFTRLKIVIDYSAVVWLIHARAVQSLNTIFPFYDHYHGAMFQGLDIDFVIQLCPDRWDFHIRFYPLLRHWANFDCLSVACRHLNGRPFLLKQEDFRGRGMRIHQFLVLFGAFSTTYQAWGYLELFLQQDLTSGDEGKLKDRWGGSLTNLGRYIRRWASDFVLSTLTMVGRR